MKKTIVRYEVDLDNPPPLTQKQKDELAALALRTHMDYSDIPPLSDEALKNAKPRRLYKPTKTSTTVRIDSDVLAWLKGYGKGYHTRINALLRDAMLRSVGRHA